MTLERCRICKELGTYKKGLCAECYLNREIVETLLNLE